LKTRRKTVLEFKKRIEAVEEKLSGSLSDAARYREEYTLHRLKIRRELWLRQRGKCACCGADTHLHLCDGGEKKRLATYEHVIPKSAGGGNGVDNGVITCHECNNKRGVLPFDEFVNKVKLHGVTAVKQKSRNKERRESNKFYNYAWALHVFWNERTIS